MSGKTLIFLGLSGNLATRLIELVAANYNQIIGFDIKPKPTLKFGGQFDFVQGNITDPDSLSATFDLINAGGEVHLAHFVSILSGGCEKDRDLAIQVNVQGAQRVFELCARHGVTRILFPSSLAIFGAGDQLPNPLPEEFALHGLGGPAQGLYGLTKRWVMDLGKYYAGIYGIDFRSAILPMVLSPDAPPGAASAYASRAFVEAINGRRFTFPVSPDTGPSLAFFDDAISALASLLLAGTVNQSAYQIHGFTGTAAQIAAAIAQEIPGFEYDFQPDPKVDALMRSWPRAMSCDGAGRDLNWAPKVTSLAQVVSAFRAQ